jgi:hypothetical protein
MSKMPTYEFQYITGSEKYVKAFVSFTNHSYGYSICLFWFMLIYFYKTLCMYMVFIYILNVWQDCYIWYVYMYVYLPYVIKTQQVI